MNWWLEILLLPHEFVVVSQGQLARVEHLEIYLVPVDEKLDGSFQIGLDLSMMLN